jgi:hypothetical protein
LAVGRKKSHREQGLSVAAVLAEAVRFELTKGFPLPVFKTGAIDHSATLPTSEAFYASLISKTVAG